MVVVSQTTFNTNNQRSLIINWIIRSFIPSHWCFTEKNLFWRSCLSVCAVLLGWSILCLRHPPEWPSDARWYSQAPERGEKDSGFGNTQTSVFTTSRLGKTCVCVCILINQIVYFLCNSRTKWLWILHIKCCHFIGDVNVTSGMQTLHLRKRIKIDC